MGKWLSVIIGLVLVILGIVGIIKLWSFIGQVILACIVLAVFFIGLGALIFGLSELRAPAETPPAEKNVER
jgi:hypothetical protein